MNPKIRAMRIVIAMLLFSVSKYKAKKMNVISVNEGGTNIVEIIRASLFMLMRNYYPDVL